MYVLGEAFRACRACLNVGGGVIHRQIFASFCFNLIISLSSLLCLYLGIKCSGTLQFTIPE